MIKSISRNGRFYKNMNNVGLVYEYLGNNAFTNEEIREYCDFLQQTGVMSEFMIMSINGVKKYYVTFFMGERGWANNIHNYDNAKFSARYNQMLSHKPKIEKLKCFENKLLDTNLKLYNFDESGDNVEYVNKTVLENGFKTDAAHLALLSKHFSEYVNTNIGNSDYKDFILKNYFARNANYDFFTVDQEIFEPVLNFVSGNKFFLFPFFIQGLNQKVGKNEYQTLDMTQFLMFLDSCTKVDFKNYLLKISVAPRFDVQADKNDNLVIHGGEKSFFDLASVDDPQGMFFDTSVSLFCYTNKPDISSFLTKFAKDFESTAMLVPRNSPSEFNEMFLSHNAFGDATFIAHPKNVFGYMRNMKEYLKKNKRGVRIGSEFFSSNPIEINMFDLVGLDPSSGELASNANGFIVGGSGSGKTYFAKNFFRKNTTDQVIVLDPVGQFAKIVTEENAKDVNLLVYGHEFPNIVGRITRDNISQKQGILYKIVIGSNSELPGTTKEAFRGIINPYLEKLIGTSFSFSRFIAYVDTIDNSRLSVEDKRLFLSKLDGINGIMKSILNNETDLLDAFIEKQKVVISYESVCKEADKEYADFIKSLLVDSVYSYLIDKKSLPEEKRKFKYSIVMLDEAGTHLFTGNPMLEQSMNGIIRQVRNYLASVVLISQSFDDFHFKTLAASEALYQNSVFHICLSPDCWEGYVNYFGAKTEDSRSKIDIVFSNLTPQLTKIAEKYAQDKKDIAKLEKDKTRFCVFGFKASTSYFIVNTNK